MGYETIIRNAVASILSPQFETMKLDIQHRAWIGSDGRGGDLYATAVSRRALVDLTRKRSYTRDGRVGGGGAGTGLLVMTVATLYFLDPIPAQGAAGRQEPIDTRDIIELPTGLTAPILEVGGFADSGTSQPFVYKVVLGRTQG
jgi:hypothetical protein